MNKIDYLHVIIMMNAAAWILYEIAQQDVVSIEKYKNIHFVENT